jgi:DNA polymerase III subunit alpha
LTLELYDIFMRFTHLHTHSHYSLLQALPKIPDLVKKAKECGMEALALTDSGNMYGTIEFYKECQKQGIKPIIGVDFYVANRTRHDREARIDNKRSRMILLAKNLEGYKNLIKLVTRSNLEGFYYKPRIDQELIQEHHEGLILISPSFSGDIAIALKNRDEEKAQKLAENYKNLFKDNFYIELTHHPEIEGHEENMQRLQEFAKNKNLQNSIPLVAAHDVYYLEKEDKKARETLVSIQNEYTERTYGDDLSDWSFIDQKTAKELFKDTPEAISNIEKIINECNLELPLGKWLFPNFVVESGLSHDDELRRIVYEGLESRGLPKDKEVIDRIEYELGIIKTKGYAPYFLAVGDLLRFAHVNGILTTIRGSVAGSIVTYLARITTVNPLEYKLPFERFLNPERPSAPDIDMDYADNRRDEVIKYAREKYGRDKVAQIGTFGTMMARGAVRDVARALRYDYSLGDKIAKLIPMGSQGFPMTIDRALEMTPELQALYEQEKDVKHIIDMAKKIEGCARHISVHAAGVVISPIPLNEIVPVQFDPKSTGLSEAESKIITQYDMHYVDENNAGLLKFDFLGLRNLAILSEAVRYVKAITGTDVDIENIPLDNQKTFEMLARGETMGLFQLNGTGMTKYLIDLKPTRIHDINAMVALYRPGPMESIPEYIERKHNPSKIRFLDPRMKDILDQSYGVLTYQDDVMMIAIKLGGYSWLEADKLRKAMGKKIPKEMAEQKDKLLEGLIKNGMTEKKANELWKLIEPFAAYGFNKAHAASYGRVAYQTAYMKANFPAIYMAAALSAESGDIETIAEYVEECKRMNIPVLPPNINESFKNFAVVKDDDGEDNIRFGLYTIKNFGEHISEIIIKEKKENGKFKDLEDFLCRVKDRNLNKKSLEALIKVGALDEFEDRGILLNNLDYLLAYSKEQKNSATDHESLFAGFEEAVGAPKLRLDRSKPATQDEKLLWEKELLGLYISGHPLDKHADKFEKHDTSIKKLKEDYTEFKNQLAEVFADPTLTKTKKKEWNDKRKAFENKERIIAGIITESKEIITKNNTRMMFMTLSDKTSSIECVVFSRAHEEFKELLHSDACIAIKGKINERNGEISFIVDKIKKL